MFLFKYRCEINKKKTTKTRENIEWFEVNGINSEKKQRQVAHTYTNRQTNKNNNFSSKCQCSSF